MKFIDFFAGIGGFRRGMELAGHTCVGFCEFDKFATASYTSMHLLTEEQREKLSALSLQKRQKEILKEEYRNGEWYANDIRNVRGWELPKSDCWCAGFPCQDISVAGKQLGFDGNRSSLYFQIIRLIEEKEEEDRPEWLFLENVKNLLSINNGWDFARVLFAMDEVGYDCEWGVLNSKNFGVPQNRERVFIIGHNRRCERTEVFPVEGTDGENRVSIIGHRDGYRRNMQTYSDEGITEALDTAAGGNREFHITIPVLTPDRAEKRQNGRRFKENGEPMFTLTAQDRHGVGVVPKGNIAQSEYENGIYVEISEGVIVYAIWYEKEQCYIAIRKLTPKECFRLQGWTDDYFEKAEFVNSNSQLYKQAGNGVTVFVIAEIAKKLKKEG